MKNILYICLCYIILFSNNKVYSQNGFTNTYTPWYTPKGGYNDDKGDNWGYYIKSQSSANSIKQNEHWEMIDINGDKLPDLVVTSIYNSSINNYQQFDAVSSPYWKVYLNNGKEFSSSFTKWQTPKAGNSDYKKNALGLTETSNNITIKYGQNWSLSDMDGDGKLDLVVMSLFDIFKSYNLQFGIKINKPYWNVYINTGNGFTNNALKWETPLGGIKYPTNVNAGYIFSSHAGFQSGGDKSESWNLVDMNGDKKADIVVTSEFDLNLRDIIQFGLGNSPFWKVYINDGKSFSKTAITWYTPFGGRYNNNGLNEGFNLFNPYTSSGDQSEKWNVYDINGDHQIDLVITGVFRESINNYTQFGLDSIPYWKVYLNNSMQFDTIPIKWKTPKTKNVPSNSNTGFYSIEVESGNYNGSEIWNMIELNGDNKPDLVLFGENFNYRTIQYGIDSLPFWKVFYNEGQGFADSSSIWLTPRGGKVTYNKLNQGYITNNMEITESINNSEIWTLTDINGDSKTDLVVTSIRDSIKKTTAQFDNGNDRFWKVYLNTSTIGIENKELINTIYFDVFPNPTSNITTISVDKKTLGEKLYLYNFSGKNIYTTTIVEEIFTINLESFPCGIYLIQLGNRFILNKKIVKL